MAATVSIVTPKAFILLRTILEGNLMRARNNFYEAKTLSQVEDAWKFYILCKNTCPNIREFVIQQLENNSESTSQSIYSSSRLICSKQLSEESSTTIDSLIENDPDSQLVLKTLRDNGNSAEFLKEFCEKRINHCIQKLTPEVVQTITSLGNIASNFANKKQLLTEFKSLKKQCKFCKAGNCRGPGGKGYEFYTHTSQPVSQPLLIANASSSSVSSDTHIVVEEVGLGS